MNLSDLYSLCNHFLGYIALAIAVPACIVNLKSVLGHILNGKRAMPDNLEFYQQIFSSFPRFAAITVNLLLVFIALFMNNHFVISLGCTDLEVMPEGRYCYYVEATNEKGKTYTLAANILKEGSNAYAIENVYFNNGGYLYFDICDYEEFDDELYVFDQDGKEWTIKLTNKKASHSSVLEEKEFGASPTFFYIITGLFTANTLSYLFAPRKRYFI